MTAPFRVSLRLHNNRMIRARERLGFASAKKAADALGISYPAYVELENFRTSPLDSQGEWRDVMAKLPQAVANA